MDDLKNKMYNYEATPPAGVWEAIVTELDRNEARVIPIAKRSNKTFYYLAAASVGIILFSLIFFTNRPSKSDKLIATSQSKLDTGINDNTVLITVPTEEKTTVKNNTELQRQNKSEKGRPGKKQSKEDIKTTNDNLIASNTSRYITIEGQQGQPVKISSKMALLVDSSETKVSTKPVWNKKVNEWKEIMKVNTLAPTTVNFLDIVELTKTIKDK